MEHMLQNNFHIETKSYPLLTITIPISLSQPWKIVQWYGTYPSTWLLGQRRLRQVFNAGVCWCHSPSLHRHRCLAQFSQYVSSVLPDFSYHIIDLSELAKLKLDLRWMHSVQEEKSDNLLHEKKYDKWTLQIICLKTHWRLTVWGRGNPNWLWFKLASSSRSWKNSALGTLLQLLRCDQTPVTLVVFITTILIMVSVAKDKFKKLQSGQRPHSESKQSCRRGRQWLLSSSDDYQSFGFWESLSTIVKFIIIVFFVILISSNPVIIFTIIRCQRWETTCWTRRSPRSAKNLSSPKSWRWPWKPARWSLRSKEFWSILESLVVTPFKRILIAIKKSGAQVDFVVHSMKDLPTSLPPGMVIGAVLERQVRLLFDVTQLWGGSGVG